MDVKEEYADRRANFKTTVGADQGRKRREETTRQIRKIKRDENLRRRRLGPSVEPPDATSGCGNAVTPVCSAFDTVDRKYGNMGTIAEIRQCLLSPTSSYEEKLEATKVLRRSLSASEENPPALEVVRAGVIPAVVRNLYRSTKSDSQALVFESAWVLTNVASSSYKLCTDAVVDALAVEPLIGLLINDDPAIREQAAWCLGNITGDNVDYRDYILTSPGTIPNIIRNIETPSTASLLQHMVWALRNMTRGRPAPDLSDVRAVIKPLVNLLEKLPPMMNNEENGNKEKYSTIATSTLWALADISSASSSGLQAVMEAGVLPPLITILSVGEGAAKKCLVPAIRCLGNFVVGNDDQTQAVINAGVLGHLTVLLESPSKAIQKEACWLASNIAAGTQAQIMALMKQKGVVQKITSHALCASWEVRKEALWTLYNIFTGGSNDQVVALVQSESLRPVTEVLALTHAELGIVSVALDAIARVLEVSDREGYTFGRIFDEYRGIEYLENLQYHQSDEVYRKTAKIIESHFQGQEQEDENLVPEITKQGRFSFGSPYPKKLFADSSANRSNYGSARPIGAVPNRR